MMLWTGAISIVMVIVMMALLTAIDFVVYGQIQEQVNATTEAKKVIADAIKSSQNASADSANNLTNSTLSSSSSDDQVEVDPMELSPRAKEYLAFMDELNKIVNYCFEHANRPNPVQDLLDKGLVNTTKFSGKTCADVKQGYDNLLEIQEFGLMLLRNQTQG